MAKKSEEQKPSYQVTISHTDNMKIAMKFNCIGDGIMPGDKTRYLILLSGDRIEVPSDKYIFTFSHNRNSFIKKDAQQDV